MTSVFAAPDAGTLTSYSVGILDDKEPMMVLEFARTPEDLLFGTRYKLPLVMSADMARELGQALLLAADTAEMGAPLTETVC